MRTGVACYRELIARGPAQHGDLRKEVHRSTDERHVAGRPSNGRDGLHVRFSCHERKPYSPSGEFSSQA